MLPLPLAAALAALVELTVTVAPGRIEEPCFPMASGDRLEYQFTASAAMDFNLHYHEGSNVVYPQQLTAVREYAGEFRATIDQTYCLMWTNRGGEPVELNYLYRLYTEEVENAPATGHR